MKRSEQDIRFQWDLTKIYPDTAAWETAMQEAEAALAPLKDLPGTLGTSKEERSSTGSIPSTPPCSRSSCPISMRF